jgi:hypothetical protein
MPLTRGWEQDAFLVAIIEIAQIINPATWEKKALNELLKGFGKLLFSKAQTQ